MERNLLSLASVKLELFTKDSSQLESATGFILEVSRQFYIITNWHVVSGYDFRTRDSVGFEGKPHRLRTLVHKGRHVGSQYAALPLQPSWGIHKEFVLYDEKGKSQWIEFKVYTQSRSPVDIVAIPLDATKDLDYPFPMEVFHSVKPKALYETVVTLSDEADNWRILAIPWSWINTDESYGPSDAVQIVGYPRGLPPVGISGPGQVFWKTGFIASENNKIELGKAMLVDVLVDEGMSGAPVVGMKAGKPKLLGVYGGKYLPQASDFVGIVWSADVFRQLNT